MLLTLVSDLARVEVTRLGVQGHKHVSLDYVAFLRFDFCSLSFLGLQHVVLLLDLAVQHGTDSWKLEVVGDIPVFKSLFYLLLENDQFVLHLRIDVPLIIGWPKSPKGIADYVAESRLLLAKYVVPKLRQYVLPLLQLLPYLLLLSQLPLIFHGVRLLHCV